MAYTFARFMQLKRQFEEDWILLKGPNDYLWTFADDAEELADELSVKVQHNKNGRAFLTIKEGMLDEERFSLIGINDSDDEFLLRYVAYYEEEELEEELEVEPEQYPATTWYVVEIESQDEIRRIIAVDDPDITDEAEGIYNRKHPFSEAIMDADRVGKDCFSYRQKSYHVEFLQREEPYLAFLEKQRYFLNLNCEPKTIHIYSSKNYAAENNLTQVSAYVFFDGSEMPIKITAYYSPEKNEYFLSLESLNAYRMDYGFPYIMADQAPGEILFDDLGMAEESIFRIHGYSVSKTVGLSKHQRQEILARMIDFKIVTKWQTVHFLEGMISLAKRKKKTNMEDAIQKWGEDLRFIHEYQQQGLPEIWGDLWLDF